ncbi:hypothetical protein [Streptomyces sp. SP18CS02]|uniref:hypothetical protein n=1 Tax=Streptomyces sp. SP18CS02 TaxID=3002531 RepID=UPI002E763EAE|nr:hypothetical protein [Streptomyces sp. SP18CS02]MEE1752794.1 hypothetical protein [Streptomyces sp. SP18CS02]
MSQADVESERVTGRVWTVRLDAAGRGVMAVKVSCSRPACAPRRLGSVAQGRSFAAAHLGAHLRAAAGPRREAACACRAAGCQAHTEGAAQGHADAAWRCGGATVLAVVTDPAGRWWRAWECCSRCAAAHPAAQVVATAPPATASGTPDGGEAPARAGESGVGAPVFSAAEPTPPGGNVPGGERLPTARAAAPATRPRRPKRWGKIAQRPVPHDLRPVALRDELIELGDAFRAYQRSSEPDLALLADLHERKANAFTVWADVTGDKTLRAEALRAEQAAAHVRLQHEQRTGQGAEGAVARVLTAPGQWEHARAVLAHVRDHAPVAGPEGRLLVLMLTLRTARDGSGNVTGQDLTGWPLGDAEQVLREVLDTGWLRLPGTVTDLLASGSDNPTHIVVPSLLPHDEGRGPLGFGKTTRAKLSGWAQKVVGERKLRKKKLPAAGRLLALACAAHSDAEGRLGASGQGLEIETLAGLCAVDTTELRELVTQLIAAEWLTDVSVTGTHVTGRLCERVLAFGCPVPSP